MVIIKCCSLYDFNDQDDSNAYAENMIVETNLFPFSIPNSVSVEAFERGKLKGLKFCFNDHKVCITCLS